MRGRDVNSIFAAKHGAIVLAVDRSSVAVEQLKQIASEQNLKITCEQVDFRDFSFPLKYFDIVLARTSLDHIPENDLPQLISNIFKSLTKDGLVFVSVFGVNDPGYKETIGVAASDCANQVQTYYTRSSLVSLFDEFVDLECDIDYYLDESTERLATMN